MSSLSKDKNVNRDCLECQSDAVMSFVASLRYSARIGLTRRKTISFEELFVIAQGHCLDRYKFCDLEVYGKDDL